MPVNLKDVMLSLNELITLHRYNIHKTAQNNGLYIGQEPVLEFIANNENCTQSRLAEKMHVSSASIAVSIRRMQKAGFIQKSVNEDDLRCNYLKLTEKGYETLKKCRAEFDKVDKSLFSGFSDKELGEFVSYIERLKKNISVYKPSKSEIMDFMKNEIKKKHEMEEEDN